MRTLLSSAVLVVFLTNAPAVSAAKAKKTKRPHATQKQKPEGAPPLAAPAPTPAPALAPPKDSKVAAQSLESVLEPVPTQKGAEQLYQNAEFAQSILMLDKLLRTELTHDQKKQARLYMALNFFAVGNEERARQALHELLDLDPDYALPTITSPSVRAFFDTVKTKYKIIPTIDHTPPKSIAAQSGAELVVTLGRMRAGYQPKLFFRPKGTPYFNNIDLVHGDGTGYTASIPPAMLIKPDGYTLEYFLVVTEGTDVPLVQLRDPQSPFSVPVDVPVVLEAKPVYKRWYFWVALTGAVVVAGGVATLVVLLTRQDAPPNGDANVVFRF
ncbi:MAG: hypothetical protein IT381_22265 [Deltaproteobacteria bacterium]|nr:hypothetical protein [Deltaproteobacteria bacterium]